MLGSRRGIGVLSSLVALALTSVVAFAPGVAAADSAVESCSLTGAAKLTPPLSVSGGQGTYTLDAGVGALACAASGSIDNSTKDTTFHSAGSYTSDGCGRAVLTGPYTLAPESHTPITGSVTVSYAGGAATISGTVSQVSGRPATGTLAGAAATIPVPQTVGGDCAATLMVNGQFALSASF